jgi:hypothetical protein
MPIFAPVFRALKQVDAPFLVIGGHAVVLHGHLRNTFDLDLLIADSKFDTGRAALAALGFEDSELRAIVFQYDGPTALAEIRRRLRDS